MSDKILCSRCGANAHESALDGVCVYCEPKKRNVGWKTFLLRLEPADRARLTKSAAKKNESVQLFAQTAILRRIAAVLNGKGK